MQVLEGRLKHTVCTKLFNIKVFLMRYFICFLKYFFSLPEREHETDIPNWDWVPGLGVCLADVSADVLFPPFGSSL